MLLGSNRLWTSVVGILGLVLASSAHAVTTNYGSRTGDTVTFNNIVEDSPDGGAFGSPTISGNTLDFDPTGVGAFDSGGGVSLFDGLVSFEIVADLGSAINNLEFTETGDYTLSGTGTSATAAVIDAPVLVDILALDGVDLIGGPIKFTANMVFTPSGGTYNLIDDPGNGIFWSGEMLVDLDQAIADAGESGQATRVNVVFENSLSATSESFSTARIQSKDIDTFAITVNVPEPTALVLLAMALLVLASFRGVTT